jgi:hypothetical protein
MMMMKGIRGNRWIRWKEGVTSDEPRSTAKNATSYSIQFNRYLSTPNCYHLSSLLKSSYSIPYTYTLCSRDWLGSQAVHS